MALGDAKDIYAYRQITAEEMTRAATLVMAYGIQMTGPNWKTSLKERSTTYNATAPGTGYTCLKSKGGTTVIVKLTHTFDFSNFCPLLSTKSELSSTFLNVTGSMKGTTGDGGSEGQSYAPRTYTEGSFVITSSDEYNGIYDATMTISSLTVNATDGITVTLKDGTSSQFGNITPLTFGNGNWKYSANPLVDGVEEWK